MKQVRSEVVDVKENSKINLHTQIQVTRLIRDEVTDVVIPIKKYVYLRDIVSYEEDYGQFPNWEDSVIYVTTIYEGFFCSGNVEDFHREILKFNKYVESLTEEC